MSEIMEKAAQKTFVNRYGAEEVVPTVGDGATIGSGSDCYPATVISVEVVERGKIVVTVQQDWYDVDKEKREDVFTPNPNGRTESYRLEQDSYLDYRGDQRRVYSYWHQVVMNEDTDRWNKCSHRGSVGLGARRYYKDPHF